MNLYCITLFLSDEKIREIVSLCEKNAWLAKNLSLLTKRMRKSARFRLSAGA